MSRRNAKKLGLLASLIKKRRSGGRRTRRHRKQRTGYSVRILAMVFVLMALAGTVGYQQVQPVLASWTTVHHISVTGLERMNRGEIIDRLALPPGSTLFDIDLSLLSQRLESHPWIDSVVVGRVLPDTVTVAIRERRPAAILRYGTQMMVLDQSGIVLSNRVRPEQTDLPILEGINPTLLLNEDPGSQRTLQKGMKVAGWVLQRFESKPVVQIKSPDEIFADVQGVRFQFGAEPESQWKRYQLLNSTIHAKNKSEWKEIDLRYPRKVIFRQRG